MDTAYLRLLKAQTAALFAPVQAKIAEDLGLDEYAELAAEMRAKLPEPKRIQQYSGAVRRVGA